MSAAPGKAESDSYSVSSAVESRASLIVLVTIHGGCKVSRSESHSDYTRLALRQRTPGKAESDSYSVSSAVESLGPSNEHFDQHEQGRKYGTQQFREPLLQCDEHISVGERSGRA